MTTDLSKLDVTNLGDADEIAPKIAMPGMDPDYQEFLEWKAWRATQDASAAKQAAPVMHGPKGTVRIIVDESPEMPPTGYPLGLNGIAYIIRPGEPVDVPLGLLEVLQNAITAVPMVDSTTRRVTGYRNRPRIPWRYAA